MVDPTTTNRGYAVPVTGTDVDTWGDVVNSNWAKLDKNIGGIIVIPLSGTNIVLTPDQYQYGTLQFSGVLTATMTVTFPQVAGWWTINNITTGNFDVILTTGFGANIAVPQGQACDIYNDGGSILFRNLGPSVGCYEDYAGSALPTWVTLCTFPPFLLCDGSSFNGTTFPRLAAILGSTTLPDRRGRAFYALDGGTGRITTAGSGIDGATRFATGGTQNIILNTSQLASHMHGTTDPGHDHVYTGPTSSVSSGLPGGSPPFNIAINPDATLHTSLATTGLTVNSAGGDQPHNNMPPAIIGGITMIRAG